jgi:hypothetical protein
MFCSVLFPIASKPLAWSIRRGADTSGRDCCTIHHITSLSTMKQSSLVELEFGDTPFFPFLYIVRVGLAWSLCLEVEVDFSWGFGMGRDWEDGLGYDGWLD